MNTASPAHFDRQYQTHLKHLKLKGLQPKTIEAYSRAIRRLGGYFSHQIDDLSEAQLTDYFSDLIETHSWSAVKLDLYGLKFYTTHVLHKPWVMPHLIKPPKTQRLPDIVTVDEAQQLFAATRIAELSGVLLHPLQSGPAPGRRAGAEGRRYRCHAPASAHSRCQRQPGSLRALAGCHAHTLRHFWQLHRHPGIALPQSPWRAEGRAQRPLAAGSRRRANHPAPGRA